MFHFGNIFYNILWYSSGSFIFLRNLHSPLVTSLHGPYTFLSIFLSNIDNEFSSVSVISRFPTRTPGFVIVLYTYLGVQILLNRCRIALSSRNTIFITSLNFRSYFIMLRYSSAWYFKCRKYSSELLVFDLQTIISGIIMYHLPLNYNTFSFLCLFLNL